MMEILTHWSLASDKTTLLLAVIGGSGISFLVVRFWLPSVLEKIETFMRAKKFWVSFCAVFVVSYLGILTCSTSYVGYLEHVEPHVASVSFVLLRGAPLYHSLDSTQRYSLLYGPMAYLPYTLALRVIGANVLSLKLVVMFANLCFLWLLWSCYRQLLGPPEALLVLVVVVGSLLLSSDYILQVRGDILIVLSVALGLFAVVRTPVRVSVLLLALACGFAFDIKITGLFYFLPLYILLVRRHGWWPAILASIAAGGFAMVPFLFPGISAAGYLEWLRQASRHPLGRGEVSRELKMLLIVCTPLGLLLWQLAQRSRTLLVAYLDKNRVFLLMLGCCLAAVAFTSSKIGAGAHHFMPFYPIIGVVCADVYKLTKGVPVAQPVAPRLYFTPLLWFWFAIAIAAQIGTDFSHPVATLLTSRSHAVSVTRDLEMVMKNHPGKKIEMGYGDMKGYADPQYQLTYFRPRLVFAGNPLTIDALALVDMQLAGVDIPRSTLEYLQECQTQIWLVPKGDPPFALPNVYSLMDPRVFPERPLFNDEFRRIFFEHYQKRGSSEFFDIWECETKSCPPENPKP